MIVPSHVACIHKCEGTSAASGDSCSDGAVSFEGNVGEQIAREPGYPKAWGGKAKMYASSGRNSGYNPRPPCFLKKPPDRSEAKGHHCRAPPPCPTLSLAHWMCLLIDSSEQTGPAFILTV